MFRHSLLPCSYLAIALGLAVLSVPRPVVGQDLSTQERLDRLERDLNMLQRQVYRGAPPPATAGDGAAVNAEIRMDRLEAQMRDLTGRVEEEANQVQQIRQRVEQINSDVEMRFNQAGIGAGSVAAANRSPARPEAAGSDRAVPPFPPSGSDAELAPPRSAAGGARAALMPPGTVVPPPSGATSPAAGPEPIFGTLRPPGAAPPPALTSTAAAHPAPARALPSGSPTEQFNHAFGLLRKADYPAAEVALKAFIEGHPRDPMAGNAQYWLGETYYARRKYMEAASAFAEGYRRYPRSARAADGLLKLGMSLARANQRKNACLAFAQLDHDFPHPGAAVKERAAAEKRRLGC
jgi:tol-pal system protein YbgF